MPGDKQEKDHSDATAKDIRSKRSFVEHLLNQPEGPDTPRAKAEPRDVEF